MALNIQQSIFSELADFITSQPALEAIAAYQVPPGVQQHIDDLLEKNSEDRLSSDERLELEKILAVSWLMDLAKAKAKLKLAGKA
jgi:hypothetical protein